MTMAILGIGAAQPPGTVAQDEAAARAALLCCHTARQAQFLHNMYRQSAVKHRATVLRHNGNGSGAATDDTCYPSGETDATDGIDHFYPPPASRDDRGPTVAERMSRYNEAALALAQESAHIALHEAQTAPKSIDHLVVVSCTGFGAPGLDVQLIDALGLRHDVQRTMIGFMGCHGAINGLRAAHAFAQQATYGRVLLCCVELCSLHFQYGWDAQRVVANALFADGAAAAVGAPAAQDTDKDAHWRLQATGSQLVPDSRDAMTWRIGDHGFEMTLSPQLPELICAHLRPWLRGWLAQHELTIEQVGSWAVHPGGPRVLDAAEEALHLPRSATAISRQVLADCGNMSSPTVLFIIDRLRNAGADRPCVALAFGPGVMIEAALFV